ncbi:hypothetical protein [Halorhodospira sp. 9622]|uniref:hypothetical protein n=1 Tax=Halorhodospira sp. 9622 TaxID=2899136 RepID=UPI001EE9799E|nr:hypothetical protein [Halorhodospira sp. 9622]MCG5538939.1 hypothetical protein [Halorhodospira sp. 9622]
MKSWGGELRPWWRRIGDASSRFGNALIGGSPAETISGRAYREAKAGSIRWQRIKVWIDRVFKLFGERAHCRRTHQRDLEVAKGLLEAYR